VHVDGPALTAHVLDTAWELRVQAGRARIHRRADGQPVAALTAGEAAVVSLMDGTRSLDQLDALMTAALGDAGRRLLERVQARFRPLLATGRHRPSPYALVELAGLLPPDPNEGLRLLPGPRVLHWHVTRYCPRRCVYCYAEPLLGGEASDAVISRAQLRSIFREAVSLGAHVLLASGSEPLLRLDLPEVLGDAISAGLEILLTTKHPVSATLAQRFADAGVPHLSFSLDTVDPDENDRLIGNRAYARQVERSVEHLRSVGVAFSIQAVATRVAPQAVRGVAAFAAAAGARVLQLVPFRPVRRPIGTFRNEELVLADESALDGLVDELARAYPGLRVEKFRELSESAGFHCDIGQTKLFFLPDGVVHRCYKLTDDARLRGADLRRVSVATAWHFSPFRSTIAPPRHEYQGAACASCARFDACHDDGRCIYQALVRFGRYTAPDRECGMGLVGIAPRARSSA